MPLFFLVTGGSTLLLAQDSGALLSTRTAGSGNPGSWKAGCIIAVLETASGLLVRLKRPFGTASDFSKPQLQFHHRLDRELRRPDNGSDHADREQRIAPADVDARGHGDKVGRVE
jgi:hypothetical protein